MCKSKILNRETTILDREITHFSLFREILILFHCYVAKLKHREIWHSVQNAKFLRREIKVFHST